jgi:hypothetical protein
MKLFLRFFALIAIFIFSILIVAESVDQKPSPFRQYWYAGKAELTRYALDQARYGEIHKGEAVLIFVTEPFLKDKQVKLDYGSSPNALSVLKLNFVRKFYTGIYPYSILTSVFTPVDYQKQRTLKVSSTTQEWCGHTYTQLNLQNNQFHALMHSYFEDEADQDFQLNSSWLEDELWTRVRLSPETLPTGEIDLIPALVYSRLRHTPLKVEKAVATRVTRSDREIYTVEYKTLPRKLEIQFEKKFPYQIVEWSETYPGGFDKNAKMLTTHGVKTNSILLDYWNKNGVKDDGYRKQLGLSS